MFFYHPESSCAIERQIRCRVEILEIVDVGCHDPNQSLFGDVGANANIIDVVFPIAVTKSIEAKLTSHWGKPKKLEGDVNEFFKEIWSMKMPWQRLFSIMLAS
jgi:hypothetical protein